MTFIELGALIIKIILSLKIEDGTSLDISKDMTDFAKVIVEREYDRRNFLRKIESIGDMIAKSSQDMIEHHLLNRERQDVLVALVINTLKDFRINSTLMMKIKRNPELLAQQLIEKGKRQHAEDELDPSEFEVYSSVLHHSAIIIVNGFNKLPDLLPERSEYLLSRLDSIADDFETVINDLKRIEKSINNLPEKYKNFEGQYRRNIVTQNSYIQLFGIDDIGESMKKYKLSTAYVQLKIECVDEKSSETSILDTCDLFANNRRNIWISGDAGSGKTTYMSWLAIQTSLNERQLNFEEDVIPIIVELRSLNLENLSIKDCINKVMINSTYSIPEGWFEHRLSKGKILFLFDGFDEISENNRRKVFDWIRMLDEDDKCYKVFTSRPQVSIRPADIAMSEIKILPMKMSQIVIFIQYWHNAVLRDQLRYSEDEVMVFQKNLISQLKNSNSLLKLAANPLLCAIISALHSKHGMNIPNSRRDLYEECCKMLLDSRDNERRIRCRGIALSYEHKKRIASKLAYHMMRNNQSEFDKVEAIRVLKTTLEDMNLQGVKAENLLSYLLERSGLIQEPEFCKISFVHRSFEEYLCAIEMHRQEDWNYAEEKLLDDSWLETICLLVGFGNRNRVDHLINETLKQGGAEDNSEKAFFYALEYLSNALDVDPELRSKIREELSTHIPPRHNQVQSLIKAGELVVPYLSNKEYFSAVDRYNCLNALIGIGTIQALEVSLSYLDSLSDERELILIGELAEMIPLETLREQQIPERIASYYTSTESSKVAVSMGMVRCLNLCCKDVLKAVIDSGKDGLALFDLNDNILMSENENLFSDDGWETYQGIIVPDIIANNIRNLEIYGNFQNPLILRNFIQLKSLSVHSFLNDFDVYCLNSFQNLHSIENCRLVLENENQFINGNDLFFLEKCHELELVFRGASAEVSFEHFNKLKCLKTLTIEADFVADIDYSGLLSVESLEHLVIIGNAMHCFDYNYQKRHFDVTFRNR